MPTTEITIKSARRAVMAVLLDPTTYPTWLVGAKATLSIDERWPAPGSSFRHVVGAGVVRTSDTTTVIDVDPEASLLLKVKARPFGTGHVRFNVKEIAPDTSLVTLDETSDSGPLRLLGPIINPLMGLRNRASLRALRSHMEDSTTSSIRENRCESDVGA